MRAHTIVLSAEDRRLARSVGMTDEQARAELGRAYREPTSYRPARVHERLLYSDEEGFRTRS